MVFDKVDCLLDDVGIAHVVASVARLHIAALTLDIVIRGNRVDAIEDHLQFIHL